MRLSHSLVCRPVVLLLVFVLGFCFLGGGVGFAKVELHCQGGNVDGDPGDGVGSDGGGGDGGEIYFQSETVAGWAQENDISFSWNLIGFNGLYLVEDYYFFWNIDFGKINISLNRGRK